MNVVFFLNKNELHIICTVFNRLIEEQLLDDELVNLASKLMVNLNTTINSLEYNEMMNMINCLDVCAKNAKMSVENRKSLIQLKDKLIDYVKFHLRTSPEFVKELEAKKLAKEQEQNPIKKFFKKLIGM